MVFLLLIIVGEFFSAPAITLAVSKSLCSLEIKLNSLVIHSMNELIHDI